MSSSPLTITFSFSVSPWHLRIGSREDEDMPKIDPPASNIKEFKLSVNFQAEFDAWRSAVEKELKGTVGICHEELIHNGTHLLLFWRVVPDPHKPHLARPRR